MKDPVGVYCPDCGPATVSHAVERWNVRADSFFEYLGTPAEFVWRRVRPGIAYLRPGRLAPAFFGMSATLGLGRIIKTPDEVTTDRTRVLWEEAARRGITMQEFRPFGLPRNIYFASYRGDTRVFDGLPRPRLADEASQDWMDDKGMILGKFNAAGVPVPRGGAAKTLGQAEALFHSIGGPVIVKPAIGSRSRHTYIHITELGTLRSAFLKAKELSPRVIVEEELSGFVFRITLVGGTLAGVMRREPPHVMGDGRHTLQQLIAEENKNPARQGPIFHMLDVDQEMLAKQKLSFDSVPPKNTMVVLHPKVSRSFGASTTEITDIHPDNAALFLKIADVLNDPLVGIDFMIDDMARSWHEQKCGVIECNSLPFIDLHHYPLKGPARNVAGMVWDLIFPV